MAHYLISVEFRDGSVQQQQMNDVMFKVGARKLAQTEWVMAGGDNHALEIYKRLEPLVVGCGKVVVKEIEEETDWGGLVVSSDLFFEMLKSKRTVC